MDSDRHADFDSLNHRPVAEPVAVGEPVDTESVVEPVEASFDDGLLSRLTVIEDQPLEARAAAYAQLHDELQGRLEGGDLPRSAG
ncbi:MAG TPA: hypothetical protein VEX88_00850 [Glaciibacter sp.]|nr:hypothetical protein [Glaciibacter sp.]